MVRMIAGTNETPTQEPEVGQGPSRRCSWATMQGGAGDGDDAGEAGDGESARATMWAEPETATMWAEPETANRRG